MILTIDIGGTSIKYGLVDKDQNLTNKGSFPTPSKSYEKLIEELTSLYYSFDNLDGVSISVPGSVSEDGKSTGISAIPYIYNKNIKNDIAIMIDKKVTIENDANCSVISEKWENDKLENVVSIAIGTGIGGAMIINGQLVKGQNGSAGEFGLMLGVNNSTLEVVPLSTIQMVNKHNEKFNTNLSSFDIFANYKSGDAESTETIKDFYKRLVALVLSVEYIINPNSIVFTGGITNEPEFIKIFDEEYKLIKGDMFDAKAEHKVSKYKSDANLFGAAYIWYKGEEND